MSDPAENFRTAPGAAPLEPRRLGRNRSGYGGETVRIEELLRECEKIARAKGWSTGKMVAAPGLELPFYTRIARRTDAPSCSVYISAGIHGDEPAPPLAIRELLARDCWPGNVNLWICPCLNPTGFGSNRRENHAGKDLNRQYLRPDAPEIISHIVWLEAQPAFDLCLCLHEDWEAHGFYLYELNPDKRVSIAGCIIQAVSRVCPIDPSEFIEGRAAANGIIEGGADIQARPLWPEAFFLITQKTRLCYTLEAPSDFPRATRTEALVEGVNAGLQALTQGLERVLPSVRRR